MATLDFSQYIGGADNIQVEVAFPSTQKTAVYNFNQNIAVGAEVAYYTNNVTTNAINLTYHDDVNSSVLLKVGRQAYQGQSTNMALLQARVNF